jgi:maltose O-acetyltransferase
MNESGSARQVVSERQKMERGEPFCYLDEELSAAYGRAQALLRRINETPAEDASVRDVLLRELLGHFGAGARLKPPFRCDYGFNISIGANAVINYGCSILDSGTVRIGDYVRIGPDVHIYTVSHSLDPMTRRTNQIIPRAVVIGADVWIAGGSIICPGVTIGEGAVIGAGSVVTTDIPSMALAAGNPCKVVRLLGRADRDGSRPAEAVPLLAPFARPAD